MGFKVLKRWNEIVKVETSKSRKPSYGYDFTIEGKRHRKSGFPTKGEVEAAVGKIKAAVRFGEPHKIDSLVPTIGRVASVYLAHRKARVGRKRAHFIEHAVEGFLEFLGTPVRLVTKITSRDLLGFQQYLLEIPYQGDLLRHPHTVNQYLIVIRSMLLAVEELFPHISFNAPRVTPLPLEHHGRERVYQDDEIERMVTAIRTMPSSRLPDYKRQDAADLFVLGWQTAARLGELLNLKVQDCPLTGKRPCIHIRTSKTKRARRVPLTATAAAIIERRIADATDEHLFPRAGKRPEVYGSNLGKIYRRAAEFAGIKWGRDSQSGVLFHTLRHTAITRMVREGHPLHVVGRWTGHTAKTMILRYSHASDEDMNAIATHLEKLDTKLTPAFTAPINP